jgi:hypothetical protein
VADRDVGCGGEGASSVVGGLDRYNIARGEPRDRGDGNAGGVRGGRRPRVGDRYWASVNQDSSRAPTVGSGLKPTSADNTYVPGTLIVMLSLGCAVKPAAWQKSPRGRDRRRRLRLRLGSPR